MKEDGKKFRVHASNTTNTYVYCFIAAKHAVEQAQKEELGRFYSCLAAGIFAAFTFEAYLNHIGQKCVRDWDVLERKLGPREKLILLQQLLKFTADQSQPPFQRLHDILYLRDSLAHGKTKTISKDISIEDHQVESVEYPQPNWKILCNLKSVKLMVDDVESIVRSIDKQFGLSHDPLISLEHSDSSITLVN
jgi:hypothetical protein